MAGFTDALRAFFNPAPGFEPEPYEPIGEVVRYRERSIDSGWSGGDASTSVAAGVRVDTESALTTIAVQAAIRLLVNDIGSLPVDALRRTETGREPLPSPLWLAQPNPANPNLTWDDHIKQTVFGLLTNGNAFTYCFPSVMNPREIRALDPANVDVKDESGLGDITYRIPGMDRVLTPFEVIHLPWLLPPGKLRGINPIEAAKQGIGIALAADNFVGSYFGNGAILSGVIEFPLGVDPSDLQIETLKADFKRKHVGKQKSHAVGALTGGASFKPFDYKNRDAQLLELRDSIVEDVARLFGIPPHMIGSQKPGAVGYASVEQRSIDYVQHAVLPIVKRIESGYGRMLRSPDDIIKFNLNGLLRADSQARAAFYRELLGIGVMVKEEVRALEDLNPRADVTGLLRTPNNDTPDPRIADAGALIRAGFDPAAALVAVGLPPITHTGLVPVTVQGENVATEGDEPAPASRSLAQRGEQPININNYLPAPEVRNEVTVQPAVVNVEPTPVIVERADAPVINVTTAPPLVTVQTPDTLRIESMPSRMTTRKVTKRDGGQIAETQDLEHDL